MADSGFYSILSIISVVGVVVCLYFNYRNSKKIAIFFSACNFLCLALFSQAMVIAFSLGVGAIPWIIMSEVCP